jgi:hypothetical protein
VTDWSDRRAQELNITKQQYANWQAGFPPEDVEAVERAMLGLPNSRPRKTTLDTADLDGQ